MTLPKDKWLLLSRPDASFFYKEGKCYGNSEGFELHCHNFYELFYLVSGNIQMKIEGKLYHPVPGSLLVIPPGCFHGTRVLDEDKIYKHYYCYFEKSFFESEEMKPFLAIFGEDTLSGCQKNGHSSKNSAAVNDAPFFLEGPNPNIQSCFSLMVAAKSAPEEEKDALFMLHLRLLLTHIRLKQRRRDTTSDIFTNDTIREVIRYVNDHLTEDIRIEEIADRFYLNKYYINRLFKEATGSTISSYILYKRVTLAQSLLFEGHSAEEAAALAGFTVYSSFYRSYRKLIGHTPIEDKGKGRHVDKVEFEKE